MENQNNICNIYIIKNRINNKVYVGATNRKIQQRFLQHVSNASKYRKKRNKLYLAMQKYGAENFYVELLEQVSEDKAQEREDFWIAKYMSIDSGYNLIRSYYKTHQTHKTHRERKDSFKRNRDYEVTMYILNNDVSVTDIDFICNKFSISKSELLTLNRGRGCYQNTKIKYPLISGLNNSSTTFEKASNIIKELHDETKTVEEIAKNYEVSVQHIININNGKYHFRQSEKYPIRKLEVKVVQWTRFISDENCKKIVDLLQKGHTYEFICNSIDQNIGGRKSVSIIDKGKSRFFNYERYYNKKDFPIRKKRLFFNGCSIE